ncbi:MAG TPA: glycosyltransferase family 39 protein [Xanthobacteraceae bacterium]|nr:glycosyltransferase family 39 protein [Xanthobacteraceae bacterium]
MIAATKSRWAPRAIERLCDGLIDPNRRERTAVIVLLCYAALWTLYGALAKSSQDIHFDMGEMVAWSRELDWGTPKHPPLGAWLVRLWFSVFPAADWAYYLLAMLLASIALWVAWRISDRFLDPEKRVAGLALLMLVPFFNFHALKFNANTIMIPVWALATWAFLRSFEAPRPFPAALAGLAAAAAMLGKYWSVFLLAGLVVAALSDPRRGRYFRSAAPWITVLVGFAALAPHLAWLVAHDFPPFKYAVASHPGTLWSAARSGADYVLGAVGYIALPVVIGLALARPSRAALADTVWPHDPDRRFIVLAFAAPIVLPILAAMLAKADIVSLWAMGSMTLLPVVLLSSPRLTLTREAVAGLVMLAIGVPVVLTALAPAIAFVIHQRGIDHHATHYRLLAQAVERAWRQTTDRPLRLVGSYDNLLNGMAFYFADRPSTAEIVNPERTPWADEARIAREGIALACPVDERPCMKALAARAAHSPDARRTDVEIARRFFGTDDRPERFVIVVIPPRT